MDPILRRRRWIIHRKLEGWKIKEIADALRINEKTIDRWLSIHRKHGWEGVNVKSRKPHRYYKTPQSTVNLILELRRCKHWGPCKIEAFHKAYVYKSWMFSTHENFVNYWSYQRPHQGIDYLYPAHVYFRDRCGGIAQYCYFRESHNNYSKVTSNKERRLCQKKDHSS